MKTEPVSVDQEKQFGIQFVSKRGCGKKAHGPSADVKVAVAVQQLASLQIQDFACWKRLRVVDMAGVRVHSTTFIHAADNSTGRSPFSDYPADM